MQNSRLKSTLQKKATHNILLAIFGIIVVLFLLFTFGTQLLIQFSLLLEKIKGSDNAANTSQQLDYIAPPTLNSMESATNSAKVTISGYSDPKQTIRLYVNGKLIDKKEVDEDKSFEFRDVELKPGENDIKAKALTEADQQSDYSTALYITYVDKPPTLDIDSPSDGQTFSGAQITVSGKTDSGDNVTINGFWAITADDGKFSYNLKLKDGENKIKIESTDAAGNKTTKEVKVTYSP